MNQWKKLIPCRILIISIEEHMTSKKNLGSYQELIKVKDTQSHHQAEVAVPPRFPLEIHECF